MQEVFRAMQFALPVDQNARVWGEFDEASQNPGAMLDIMSIDVANLLATAKRSSVFITNSTLREAQVSVDAANLLRQAKAVDSRLATWPEFVPVEWFPTQISADSIPESVIKVGLYRDSCHIYPDIIVSSVWNECKILLHQLDYSSEKESLGRVARLKVLDLVIRIQSIEIKSPTATAIQQIVDDICASVPFNLGDYTEPTSIYEAQVRYPHLHDYQALKAHQKTALAYAPWYLFAPLKEAMKAGPHLRKGQIGWLRGQLLRIAKVSDVIPR